MLLIDAFNVLHLPEAVAADRSLTAADLVSLLGASRYAGEAAVLVCDGSGDGSIEAPRGKRGRVRVAGVEILFSGPDGTADDEIEARLKKGGGHGMTVVSDDRRLRRAATRVRARSLGSGTFLAHLLTPRDPAAKTPVPAFARDIPLDRYSVAHWMQAFGLTPGELLDRDGDAAVAGRRPTGAKRKDARSRPETGPKSGPNVGPKAGPGAKPDTRPTPAPRNVSPGLVLPAGAPVLPELDLDADPVIRAALEEWRGRLRVEDLDMTRWLEERGRGKR